MNNIIIMKYYCNNTVVAHHTSRVKSSRAGNLATGDIFLMFPSA